MSLCIHLFKSHFLPLTFKRVLKVFSFSIVARLTRWSVKMPAPAFIFFPLFLLTDPWPAIYFSSSCSGASVTTTFPFFSPIIRNDCERHKLQLILSIVIKNRQKNILWVFSLFFFLCKWLICVKLNVFTEIIPQCNNANTGQTPAATFR